ncbi:membrane dipeptidase [Anaerotignum lactatifermentans]|uniref:Membrane dipeptidase n=1 Tax=Anaerotignum lactatifermentans TaxID=160404 RepID=A0ABS2G9A3_9FIRM|nr:dipeptidase [Anaerotignum lactatifermentans]MBM6829776.1 membrane dipeptidase [Anaerotignum lactatifermentans]MBM6877197.1 membrane dipeptidase [Anaerotignum lactatifermentans]MBM6951435.1 membrane dipeptidase [Anaerotignum lactatifermentans]
MKGYADAHCDTAVKLFGRGEGLRRNGLHLDLERLSAFPGSLQVFALWLDPKYYPIALRQTMKYLTFYKSELERNKDLIRPVYTYEDLLKNQKEGRLSALLSLEGGEALEGETAVLEVFYELGVRMMTLTWNYRNQIADGVLDGETGGGLTPFGKRVIRKMEELGMAVDVSHLSDAGFYDVANMAKRPFLASHSNARAVCPHPRNLTDDQLRILKEIDGFVGLNFYPRFVAEKETVTQEDLLRQLYHLVEKAGEDHVGFGSDFDGIDTTPSDLRQVEDMAGFLARLEREFGRETAAKLRQENLTAALGRILK